MAAMSMDELIAVHVAGLAPRTRENYKSHIKDWLHWCHENDIDPWKAGHEHIELYGRWLLESRGQSTNTRYSAMGEISRLYTDAYHRGLIPQDPAPLVRRPRRRYHSDGTWLNREQASTLLHTAEQADDPRMGALVCLLMLSGLRIQEALSLDIDDYKPGNPPTLHVKRKNGWEQTVAISQRASHALDRLIGRRGKGPVFLNARGRRLSYNRMFDIFARLKASCGLDFITPHSLRRTFATLSREAGVPDIDIMAAGGWTTKQMLDYYDMHHHAMEGKAAITLSQYLG